MASADQAVTSGRSASARALADRLVDAWGSWAPTLDPTASRIAFLSDRDGAPAVWVQDLPSAAEPAPAAHRISLGDDPVTEVSWSADGRWLACCVATGGGVRTQVWVVRPDGTDARRVAGSAEQHAELGPWTRSGHRVVVTAPGQQPGEPSVCLLADPASGDLEPLAEGDLISVLDLSVDEALVIVKDGQRGQQFCVVVDRVADADHPLLPYPALGSTDRAMVRPAPPVEGRVPGLVAYVSTDAGLPRRQLLAVPLGPHGWRGESGILAPRADAELEGLDADDPGRLLLLVWNVAGGGSEVQLLDTGTGGLRTAPGLDGLVVTSGLLSRDGTTAVLAVEGPCHPRELWRLDTATLRWSPVTDRPELPDTEWVAPTLEHFTGRDGLPLSGWLYRGAGGAPGPAVVSLHGGPEAQERPVFNPSHQAMAAAGLTVFAPNVRGSSGFGRSFVHADDGHGRPDAFADVLAARDLLVERGWADPARIAVTGRSYGGYLTLVMLAFFPGPFCAGVDICGMSDLTTFYRDTEPWIAAAAASKYGDPDRDAALLRALSPLRAVDRVDVPLLVVHGELDTNVPLGEATQVVAALTALGRPVEYLQLDGEGHDYRRAESRRRLLRTVLDFLTSHLGVER